MKRYIDRYNVLILNKHWIPINTTTASHSFTLMYTDNAKGILVEEDSIVPLTWNEWVNLKANDNDRKIKTVNGFIKIPNVIVLNHYDKIPRQIIKFTQKNLWERDNFTCQYTGKKISKLTGNIDHIIPKSQGGKTSWENCVLAHKEINAIKADRTPEQAGLKLLKKPSAPRIMPVSFYIRNKDEIKDWNVFLNDA
jgi:5-methylcytosine-specific restriction endonuclease McrA